MHYCLIHIASKICTEVARVENFMNGLLVQPTGGFAEVIQLCGSTHAATRTYIICTCAYDRWIDVTAEVTTKAEHTSSICIASPMLVTLGN